MTNKEYKFVTEKGKFKKRTYSLNKELQEKEKTVFDVLIKKGTFSWVEVYGKALDLLIEEIKGKNENELRIRQAKSEMESIKDRYSELEREVKRLEDLNKSDKEKQKEKDHQDLVERMNPYIEEYKENHDEFNIKDFCKEYRSELRNEYILTDLSNYYGRITSYNEDKQIELFSQMLEYNK